MELRSTVRRHACLSNVKVECEGLDAGSSLAVEGGGRAERGGGFARPSVRRGRDLLLFEFTSGMGAFLSGMSPKMRFTYPMDNNEHTPKQLMPPDLLRRSSPARNLVVTSAPPRHPCPQDDSCADLGSLVLGRRPPPGFQGHSEDVEDGRWEGRGEGRGSVDRPLHDDKSSPPLSRDINGGGRNLFCKFTQVWNFSIGASPLSCGGRACIGG